MPGKRDGKGQVPEAGANKYTSRTVGEAGEGRLQGHTLLSPELGMDCADSGTPWESCKQLWAGSGYCLTTITLSVVEEKWIAGRGSQGQSGKLH